MDVARLPTTDKAGRHGRCLIRLPLQNGAETNCCRVLRRGQPREEQRRTARLRRAGWRKVDHRSQKIRASRVEIEELISKIASSE